MTTATRLWPRWRDNAILVMVLVFGGALTWLASSSLAQTAALRVKERETAAAQVVISTITLELTRTTEALRNAGLLLEASPQLTRAQFQSAMQKLVEHQLSVNLVEWQPVVPAAQLKAFEAAARAGGQPTYQVLQPDAAGRGWEPVHGRASYVPVLYAWPESYRTEGLDMSFSPQRMASKLQASVLKVPVASGTFAFMKEGKVDSGVTAMAISTAVLDANQTTRGYLAAVVDLPTLFGQAARLAQAAQLDLLVMDSPADEAALIYAWPGDGSALARWQASSKRPPAGTQGAALSFAHQHWQVWLLPRPGFYSALHSQDAHWAMAGGTVMTLLIALALYQLQRSRRRIEAAEAIATVTRDSLEQQTQRLLVAQRMAHLGAWHLDLASQQVTWSDEMYRMMGVAPGTSLPPFPAHGQFFAADSWGRLTGAVQDMSVSGADRELELELLQPDGAHGWMLMRGEAGRAADGAVVAIQAVAMDITDRKRAEIDVNNLAFYDSLTRLPNRRLLMDRMTHALAASGRHQRYGALLFIDLDNFKTINDTLGHQFGDLLLQQVAQRLVLCVRESDTVGRLGGDEFVVLLEDLDAVATEAAAKSEAIAEKILQGLNQPYRLNSHLHHSSSSIGITLFDERDGAIEDLLKRADVAMYRAKAAGRNMVRFFDQQMQSVILARAALEGDLREAVLHKNFVLHFQAQVDRAGCLTGAEALIRMRRPGGEIVSPLDFIKAAEETGLIFPVGQWVLHAACQQLAIWAAHPALADLSLAVNISARQFLSPTFVPDVLELLDASGANPQRLKLELTESVLVDDVEDTIHKMQTLKARGIRFALDDFGTGYSSLSYLKRLPLDQLKIDQAFVRNLLVDANDAAIARMITVLADSLGLSVLAEGVESSAQKEYLDRLGCHAYQGFLFSEPLVLSQFEALASQPRGHSLVRPV